MAVVDFTTFTEVDPAGDISITSTKITSTANDTQNNAYVYKDMGVDHFNGDFTHYFEVQLETGSDTGQRQNFWAMANNVGEQDALQVADQSHFAWSFGDEGANTLRRLYETDGATDYTDTDNNTTLGYGTLYYVRVKRDEAVGTYGTLYVDIYSDSGRTTLIDSQSLTLHTSKKDFRYIYGEMNDGRTQAGVVTGYTQNLDLNESVNVTVTPSAQVDTFSIPAPTYKHGSTLTPSAQVGTFSVPAYTVSLPKVVSVTAQVATFSIPAYSVILADIVVAPSVQSLTFSIPAYQVKTYVLLTPNGQTLTFSIPASTIVTEANIVLTPNTLTLTFVTPTLAKVGAVWVKRGRSTNATWVRSTRNSN